MPQKIIIAIDSFKGCLSSAEADAVAAAAFAGTSDVDVTTINVSDGGEGMLDAFANALNAEIIDVDVHDALMRPHKAHIGIAADTAIIEVAQAAGLPLIEPDQRNPYRATSYVVGEMVAEAIAHHCHKLIVGLGGTATSDCGIGMLKALVDRLSEGGTIDDIHLDDISVLLATDVDNPLLGPRGAAAVFAPQKGADAAMVKRIENRGKTFVRLIRRKYGLDASQTAGAGAAGGLGFAFLQFFNAKIESGADILFRLINFDEMLSMASIVITGEGSADEQTLMGKLPMRILQHALKAKSNPQAWLLAGRIADSEKLLNAGFAHAVSINKFLKPGEDAMEKEIAKRNLQATVRELFLLANEA